MVRLGQRHLPCLRLSLIALSRRPGLSPIGQVLSLNDDILELDPAQWEATWRKGGYGGGVFTLAYLATTRAGQSYVVTVFAQSRSRPIDPATAGPVMLTGSRWQRGAEIGEGSPSVMLVGDLCLR